MTRLTKIGTILRAAGASAEVVMARLTKIGTIIRAAGASAEVAMTRLTKIGTIIMAVVASTSHPGRDPDVDGTAGDSDWHFELA